MVYSQARGPGGDGVSKAEGEDQRGRGRTGFADT